MNQSLPHSLFDNEALRDLNKVRHKKAHGSSINAYFQHQRKNSDAPSPELQRTWFNGMKTVLQEVDEGLRCIPERCRFSFLDVGCCPGGFSSYILNKNPNASGSGISLSVENGGHEFLLEEELRPRLNLNLADLTYYQLGLTVIRDARLQPFPFPFGQTFDLVLLDGHPLRTSHGFQNGLGHRLLISQLIICLQVIAKSGTIIVKLSTPERIATAKILYMLDTLSLSLACWKPVYMHAIRPTFYAVAKGVGLGPQGYRLTQLLDGLKELWGELTYGGPKGVGRAMEGGDLDFVVSDGDLEGGYRGRLMQLCEHVWLVQTKSLQGWYAADGLSSA